MAAELGSQLASIEQRLAELEEERLFAGEYDAGDAVVTVNAGRRRHRLPGLGRDAAAHVPALGRAPRLQGRDDGGVTGRGGGAQVGDLHRPRRERLRPVRRRARRPPPGPDLALRRLGAPPHRASPRSTSRRWSTATSRSSSTRATSASTPTAPRAPAASTSTRPTPRCGITHVPTGIVVQCQNERSQTQNKAVAMQLLRSRLLELEERKRAEELAKERGEVEGGRVGLADPQLLPAPRPAGQGPPHRLRDGRRPAGARRRPRRLHPRVPEPGRVGGRVTNPLVSAPGTPGREAEEVAGQVLRRPSSSRRPRFISGPPP